MGRFPFTPDQEYKKEALMEICEIRVPTYRRPDLLQRCLKSLLDQSYPHWRAVVLDDSPDTEGKEVVRVFGDKRIIYRPNSERLGCCGNIDAAFSGAQLAGGDYACVVEDDNWLLADCLQENIASLKASDCSLLLRNQLVAVERKDQSPELGPQTTRGPVFGDRDRVLMPIEIRASLLLGQGLSNGGIFWRLSGPTSLVVGPSVRFSPLQEFCRSLQVGHPVQYAAKPLAVFSYPEDESTTRETLDNRRFNRGLQSITAYLLTKHGKELTGAAYSLPGITPGWRSVIRERVADACIMPPVPSMVAHPGCALAWAKGVAKRLSVQDPLRDYWNCDKVPELTY
jgi:hypothetical protein